MSEKIRANTKVISSYYVFERYLLSSMQYFPLKRILMLARALECILYIHPSLILVNNIVFPTCKC